MACGSDTIPCEPGEAGIEGDIWLSWGHDEAGHLGFTGQVTSLGHRMASQL